MSRIMCVGLVTYTPIAPPVPAGTIAAFATTEPSHEFRVETVGCGDPAEVFFQTSNKPVGAQVVRT
jgi:hypothetical protein